MINPQAFASGFKEACARYGVSTEALLKLANQSDQDKEHPRARGPEAAQAMANVALGAPLTPPAPGLGQLLERINSLGMYGSPSIPRQPFGS
jgi:hypothetical protein